MVQVHLGPPFHGDVAQLGEHLLCTQGVAGSIPVISTIYTLVRRGRRPKIFENCTSEVKKKKEQFTREL